jgi:hypothetical protein
MIDGVGADWPVERHAVPEWIKVREPHTPGAFAYQVDQARVPAGSSDVPAEAVVGCFRIGPDGRATGEFLRNLGYLPESDDFAYLESPDLHLEWLSERPGVVVRQTIEDLFTKQAPGSVVRCVHVVDRPRTRMAGTRYDLPERQWPPGLPRDDDETLQAVMLTDAAIAVTVTIWVTGPDVRTGVLHGVLTLVQTGLDGEDRAGSVWLEREPTLNEVERTLDERIAAVRAGGGVVGG